MKLMLTETKRKFVAARKAGLSPAKAAVKAGLSEKTASAAGSRLAKDPLVMAALAGVDFKPKKAKSASTASEPAVNAEATDDNPATTPAQVFKTPQQYLMHVVNDETADAELRASSARALLPYMLDRGSRAPSAAPVGKKEAQAQAARQVAGRFAAAAPPKLAASGGRAV